MVELICEGCKGNLDICTNLMLYISNHHLVIRCPMCKWETRITVNEHGFVTKVKDCE